MVRWMSVTSGSSFGSIPLNVMNASPLSVLISALPRMAGAAPVTPGTFSSFATSAW